MMMLVVSQGAVFSYLNNCAKIKKFCGCDTDGPCTGAPEAPSLVRLNVSSSTSLTVTFQEPQCLNSTVVTKYRGTDTHRGPRRHSLLCTNLAAFPRSPFPNAQYTHAHISAPSTHVCIFLGFSVIDIQYIQYISDIVYLLPSTD